MFPASSTARPLGQWSRAVLFAPSAVPLTPARPAIVVKVYDCAVTPAEKANQRPPKRTIREKMASILVILMNKCAVMVALYAGGRSAKLLSAAGYEYSPTDF